MENFLSSRFHVDSAVGTTAVSKIMDFRPNIVLMDILLSDVNGLNLLKEITVKLPALKIIIVTLLQEMETIIKTYRLGVYDYVRKEIDLKELENKIKNASKIASLANKLPDLIGKEGSPHKDSVIVGQSEAMCNIFKIIGTISNSRAPVGMRGETGTGKELVARLIHENSPCKDEPFIVLDCASLVETLAESTLYGHQKGAFTGAIETHKGKFEIAGNGTIFFDEISELPLSIQGKLLRFLQEKEFEKVGGRRKQKSNARIIVASNKDLTQLIRQGKFRKDLYYRLRVFTFYIPPLRERREDIPRLIAHFARKIKKLYGIPEIGMEERAYRLLQEYSWPGNVRELENLLTRIAIMQRGGLILEETVKEGLERTRQLEAVDEESLYPSLAEVEKRAILRTLKYTRWNISATGGILKISRPTVREKIRKYQLTH